MSAAAKPPRVDRYEYWGDPPPVPSPRLAWWLDRIVDEGWKPNRRISGEGYDGTAEFFGVYLWEWLNVLYAAVHGSCLNLRPHPLRDWLDSHGVRSDWVPFVRTVPDPDGPGWIEVLETELGYEHRKD